MAGVFQNIDPPPLTARRVCIPCRWCGGRTHSLGGEGGWGVNILEDVRHSSVLYVCKYLVGDRVRPESLHGLARVPPTLAPLLSMWFDHVWLITYMQCFGSVFIRYGSGYSILGRILIYGSIPDPDHAPPALSLSAHCSAGEGLIGADLLLSETLSTTAVFLIISHFYPGTFKFCPLPPPHTLLWNTWRKQSAPLVGSCILITLIRSGFRNSNKYGSMWSQVRNRDVSY
jgi:hypothetical protein